LVTLVSIVRNEAAVIGRCLDSVIGVIDRWVIVDTGSTDGTQAIITAKLAGLPGELHGREWVDFGTNRTESLRLAGQAEGDYLLILDADETLEGDDARMLDRTALAGGACSYTLEVRSRDALAFRSRRLLRADRGWRYEGAVHAIPVAEREYSSGAIDGVHVCHRGDGGSHEGRLEWALDVLEQTVMEHPDDTRSRFYLANTRRDLGDLDGALRDYSARVRMSGGFADERFVSLYRAGQILMSRNLPLAAATLLEAVEMRPDRMEPVYALARGYRMAGLRRAAYVWASYGFGRPRPGGLFVEPWIYEWGLLFEFSISAWWVGERVLARSLCEDLLDRDDLPDRIVEQVRANLALCLPVAA